MHACSWQGCGGPSPRSWDGAVHKCCNHANTGTTASSRLGEGGVPHRARQCRGQPGTRRQLRMASHSRGQGDAALSKESAQRRKVLMQFVREVQPTVMETFLEQGPPHVVSAMRTTITNMLGTLPPSFFTVTITTVGENLAQLMFSVIMTGYMLRNAQYRLELRKSLGGALNSAFTTAAASPPQQRVAAAADTAAASVLDESMYAPGVQKSRVAGEVLLWHKENGLESMEAVAYMELLEAENGRLRAALSGGVEMSLADADAPPGKLPIPSDANGSDAASAAALAPPPHRAQMQQPGALTPAVEQYDRGSLYGLSVRAGAGDAPNELLEYLQSLEASRLSELTECASAEVHEAMDTFVHRLLGTRDKDHLRRATSESTSQELGRLLAWLMCVGYTLRSMEVRFDMEQSIASFDSAGAGAGREDGTAGNGGTSGRRGGPALPPGR